MYYSNPNDYWRKQPDMYQGMSDDERMKAGCLHALFYLVAVGIAFAVCALFGSCTTTKYVPVQQQHTEHHWHTDSVHQTDSIIRETQTTIMQLDSAAMARYGIQLKSAERAWLVKTQEMERQIQMLLQLNMQKDSVHDTVPVPVPVIKEVPAQLTWWQQARMHIGGVVFWLSIIVAVVTLVRWWLKQKKVI